MKKIEIKNRFTNNVIFTFEVVENTMLLTLVEAIKQKVDLSEADLYGADLREADLSGANLYVADLSEANLRGTNLRGTNLRGTNLHRANLRGTNLHGADLSGTNLHGANLREANLEPIKNDMFIVLLSAVPEIENFRKALTGGQINGSTYTGVCACLCGTLMNSANELGHQEIFTKIDKIKDSSRPIERFFLCINERDTPENNEFSKLALEWTDEFLQLINNK